MKQCHDWRRRRLLVLVPVLMLALLVLVLVLLLQGLHRLRMAQDVNPAALMAAAEAGGCKDGRVEYREFLRHFAWPEGRVGGDAEKALYEATLARKEIVRRVEKGMAADVAANWTAEEIAFLREMVAQDGLGNWLTKVEALSAKFGKVRSAEGVRDDWGVISTTSEGGAAPPASLSPVQGPAGIPVAAVPTTLPAATPAAPVAASLEVPVPGTATEVVSRDEPAPEPANFTESTVVDTKEVVTVDGAA